MEQGGGFKFNEGMYQMERIHHIQTRMNICKNFCLKRDDATGLFGFETWYTLLNGLYLEFGAKLGPTEEEEITKKRKAIKGKMMYVIIPINGPSGRPTYKINGKAWAEVEEDLFDYELALKKLMVKHKISSPEAADPTRAVTN